MYIIYIKWILVNHKKSICSEDASDWTNYRYLTLKSVEILWIEYNYLVNSTSNLMRISYS